MAVSDRHDFDAEVAAFFGTPLRLEDRARLLLNNSLTHGNWQLPITPICLWYSALLHWPGIANLLEPVCNYISTLTDRNVRSRLGNMVVNSYAHGRHLGNERDWESPLSNCFKNDDGTLTSVGHHAVDHG